jgi:hypothetical protein
VSKVSRLKGQYYPIRRGKERERDLLKELLEQERKEEEKAINNTRKGID